jgi:hypothetical protein
MHVRLRLSKGWGEWFDCWVSKIVECSSIERRVCYAPSSPLNTPSSLKPPGQQGRGKSATFSAAHLGHPYAGPLVCGGGFASVAMRAFVEVTTLGPGGRVACCHPACGGNARATKSA